MKTQGSHKILENRSLETSSFTGYSANPCLTHSLNTINSRNWNMLSPKSHFVSLGVIPGQPGQRLHPALIGSQNGLHIQEFLIPTRRNWGRGWGKGWMRFLRLNFVRLSFLRQNLIRHSFVRMSFVRLNSVRWSYCKTELCETERLSFVCLSSVRLSFVRLSFVRLGLIRAS